MKKFAPVILKHYDLMLWLLPKVSKMPRDQKFLLGDQIQKLAIGILGCLVKANYTPARRREYLAEANLKLDYLRIMMRLCKDLNLLTAKSYAFQAARVDEIGCMIGGWARN